MLFKPQQVRAVVAIKCFNTKDNTVLTQTEVLLNNLWVYLQEENGCRKLDYTVKDLFSKLTLDALAESSAIVFNNKNDKNGPKYFRTHIWKLYLRLFFLKIALRSYFHEK